MDAYKLLQKQAAEKLDKAIQAACREYRETCDKINSLRRELGHESSTKGLRVERTFTELVREQSPPKTARSRQTPAVASGLADKAWPIRGLLEAAAGR